MHITQITVSYGETQSLPEYSNVKPSLTITATLDVDDSPGEVELLLWNEAKAAVHAQIDSALEANDKAAKYDPAPRYQVLRTYWNEWDHRGQEKPPQYVVILPDAINPDRGAYAQRLVHFARGDSRKLRYAHAQRIAQGAVADRDDGPYILLDCASGDLTALNLAIGAPESNPDVAPTPDSPF
jgi:hypothetical protein